MRLLGRLLRYGTAKNSEGSPVQHAAENLAIAIGMNNS